jgi:hypothetical protein
LDLGCFEAVSLAAAALSCNFDLSTYLLMVTTFQVQPVLRPSKAQRAIMVVFLDAALKQKLTFSSYP